MKLRSTREYNYFSFELKKRRWKEQKKRWRECKNREKRKMKVMVWSIKYVINGDIGNRLKL